MNARLAELLKKYDSEFSFKDGKWCLFGIDRGLAWETDDHEAETREQAENDAADYLKEYNAE